MVPSSDELEDFYRRLTNLRAQVTQQGAAELAGDAAVVQAVVTLAKEWLRLSQRLRAAGIVDLSTLALCDGHMGELLVGRGDSRRADTHYGFTVGLWDHVFGTARDTSRFASLQRSVLGRTSTRGAAPSARVRTGLLVQKAP